MPVKATDLKVGDKIRYDGGALNANASEWKPGRVVTVKSVNRNSVDVDVPYYSSATTNLSDHYSLKFCSKAPSAVRIERVKPKPLPSKDPIASVKLGCIRVEPSKPNSELGKVFVDGYHYAPSDVREFAHALLELCDQVEA